MKQTDNFFLIHNYNTVPLDLTDHCEDYLIMDCSDDGETPAKLSDYGLKYVTVENTGHNLTSYFSFFIEHYDNLPEWIALLKGNIIGRHITADYFDMVYDNKWFTYLYYEPEEWHRYDKHSSGDKSSGDRAALLSESVFSEPNNSWYMKQSHSYKYFYDMDDFLRFVYKNPVISRYCTFAPGGCYIVHRDQIRKNPVVFYRNLLSLMTYRKEYDFPAEAFLVERIMPLIFTSVYETNSWMNDEDEFLSMLEKCENSVERYREWNRLRGKRIRLMLGAKPPEFLGDKGRF